MWPILIVLVLGLGFSFAKIWSLSRSSMNTKKFIIDVKEKLTSGGVSEAMKLCENTRGSIASVFDQGDLFA